MEYLIHPVEMWPALCKFPILFSAIKLKLRHNFSQVINMFKIGTSKLFPNSQIEGKLVFLNLATAGIANFSQFLEELLSFSQFTIQLRNQDCSRCFYVLSDWKDCLSGRVYVLDRRSNSHYGTIFWQVMCWKHCLRPYMRLKITKFSWGCAAACRFFPIFNSNFPIIFLIQGQV